MAKDIEYFLREAKDKIAKEIPFLDYSDMLNETDLDLLQRFEAAVKTRSSIEIGIVFNDIIDDYVEKQTDKIDTLAAQMLRDYQEDCKAEAAEAIHSTKHGG